MDRTLHLELAYERVRLDDPLWGGRQHGTAEAALLAQWQNLEDTGTLDNFRVAGGRLQAVRRGFFYSDSDAHKWAEAALRAQRLLASTAIERCLESYAEAITSAQTSDGYLFTYNQIHFPGQRWVNLQVEHELYTHGHLIEAGVAAHGLPRQRRIFAAALRAAELLVQAHGAAGPERTPGHQEVEIALIRLYRVTGERRYLDLAEAFLERRGRGRGFAWRFVREVLSQLRRSRQVRRRSGSGATFGFDVQENLYPSDGAGLVWRVLPEFLSGRYQQQHAPLRQQDEPVGHAVRCGYQATAATLLCQERPDAELLATLETAWERMVAHRMYVTGGVGALPLLEGFGRDDELGNSSAYCETCAALASVFWSWELLRCTGKARYADLVEWTLSNAVAVGVSRDGVRYFYRNPLESASGLRRQSWFATACCPSNVSRTWAQLGKYVATHDGRDVWLHQYWTCSEVDVGADGPRLRLAIESELPWQGAVVIDVQAEAGEACSLWLRLPSWAGAVRLWRDGRELALPARAAETARYVEVPGPWPAQSRLALELEMPIRVHGAGTVISNRGKVALSRGPLVYCLESHDNPDVLIPGVRVDLAAPMRLGVAADLDACVTIEAQAIGGSPLCFIPYYAWANRSPGAMQVWVDAPSPA